MVGTNTPRSVDVAWECLLYDEFMVRIYLVDAQREERSAGSSSTKEPTQFAILSASHRVLWTDLQDTLNDLLAIAFQVPANGKHTCFLRIARRIWLWCVSSFTNTTTKALTS